MNLYFAAGLLIGWAMGAYQLHRLHSRLDRKHGSAMAEDLQQTLDRSFQLGKIAGRIELIDEQRERRLKERSEN